MPSVLFTQTVDELCLLMDFDPDLASGMAWLDKRARELGITLYEMVDIALNGPNRNYCTFMVNK